MTAHMKCKTLALVVTTCHVLIDNLVQIDVSNSCTASVERRELSREVLASSVERVLGCKARFMPWQSLRCKVNEFDHPVSHFAKPFVADQLFRNHFHSSLSRLCLAKLSVSVLSFMVATHRGCLQCRCIFSCTRATSGKGGVEIFGVIGGYLLHKCLRWSCSLPGFHS